MKKKISTVIGCLFVLLTLIMSWNAPVLAATNTFTLTIVSNDNGAMDVGHAFLVISNNSSKRVTLGSYILRPNKQVALGMRDSYKAHLAETGGAYLNVEAVQHGGYKDFAYKTISISSNQAASIMYYFMRNSYYSSLGDVLFHNCTTFAVRGWNMAVGSTNKIDENLVDEPWKLKDAIKELKGSKTGTNLVGTVFKEALTGRSVYYLDKNGKIIPYRLVTTKIMKREALSCNSIKLTWQEARDPNISGQDMVTGYVVEYIDLDGKSQNVYLKGKNKTQYTIENLKANTKYTCNVYTVFENHGYRILGEPVKGTKTTKDCKVTLNKTSATIDLSVSSKLTLTAKSNRKHSDKLKKVTWTSSNKSVATVNSNGVVTGKSNGTVIIKAKIHGKIATCKVKVVKPVIKLNKTTLTLNVNKTGKLTATVKYSNKKLKWKTSNASVVAISANGNKITFKGKKAGTATITAYIGKIKATCKVTVKEVDWKGLYYNFLKKAENSFQYKMGGTTVTSKAKTFYLLHLNSDKIPELVVCEHDRNMGMGEYFYVYTIKNNKVVYCDSIFQRYDSGIRYNKKRKGIVTSYYFPDYYGESLWVVRNGKVKEYKHCDTKNIVTGKRLYNTESVRQKQFK